MGRGGGGVLYQIVGVPVSDETVISFCAIMQLNEIQQFNMRQET